MAKRATAIQTTDDDDVIAEQPVPAVEAPQVVIEEQPSTDAQEDSDYLADLKGQNEALKKGQEQAEARATEAERVANEQRQLAERAVNERVSADEIAVSSALSDHEGQIAKLEADLASAYQAADFAGAAALTKQIARETNLLDKLSTHKQEIDNWKKQAVQAATQPQQQDPLAIFSPPTRAWLQAHPIVLNDRKLWLRAKAADLDAQAEGIALDSKEYFNYVEERLGMHQRADEGGDAEVTITPEPRQVRQQATAANRSVGTSAPPSRGNGNGQARRPAQVRLTPSQREIAIRTSALGDTDDERIANYARYLKEAQERGEIPVQ